MLPRTLRVIFAPLCFIVVVAACDGPSLSSKSSFRGDYLVARNALESGNFNLANKHYAALVRKSGPLEARVRLEYAHSLLRGGDFRNAESEARKVASSSAGGLRASALAVMGTAQHEMGRADMARGQSGARVTNLLQEARTNLSTVLRTHAELDPDGTVARRVALLN